MDKNEIKEAFSKILIIKAKLTDKSKKAQELFNLDDSIVSNFQLKCFDHLDRIDLSESKEKVNKQMQFTKQNINIFIDDFMDHCMDKKKMWDDIL